jgi:hypothetical protein
VDLAARHFLGNSLFPGRPISDAGGELIILIPEIWRVSLGHVNTPTVEAHLPEFYARSKGLDEELDRGAAGDVCI